MDWKRTDWERNSERERGRIMLLRTSFIPQLECVGAGKLSHTHTLTRKNTLLMTWISPQLKYSVVQNYSFCDKSICGHCYDTYQWFEKLRSNFFLIYKLISYCCFLSLFFFKFLSHRTLSCSRQQASQLIVGTPWRSKEQVGKSSTWSTQLKVYENSLI